MLPVSKSQCQNMTPINQISSPLHRRGIIPVCNRHQGGPLLWSQGEGGYQSVTGPKRREEGAVVSHPFLGEAECSDESSFSERGGPPAEPRGGGAYQSVTGTKRRGGGPVMSHPFQEGARRTVPSYPSQGEGTPCGRMGRGYDSHEPIIGWTIPFQGGLGGP